MQTPPVQGLEFWAQTKTKASIDSLDGERHVLGTADVDQAISDAAMVLPELCGAVHSLSSWPPTQYIDAGAAELGPVIC